MNHLDQMPVNSVAWRQYRRIENIAAQMRAFLEHRRVFTPRRVKTISRAF
jgi:hypothetical protein